jgi:murein DD-endopeptidase MepM/ murein hydrolase activator NlpD
MDKRIFDKSSNFFKKEGFYVVLFVCLCIVATAAAISSRNRRAINRPPVAQQEENTAVNNTNEQGKEIPNASQVNNDASKAVSVPKEGSASVTSAKPVETKFAKPVEGVLVREFTENPDVYCPAIASYQWNIGIDIQAEAGTSVVAVLDGKVEKVDNDGNRDLGQYVIISHSNGLKTIYANLDENVSVKAGDTVKRGSTVIGTIGNTRENYADESLGDYLHFQVMKNSEYQDPAQYISYNRLDESK